jgi:hypothetical protein
MHNEQLDDLYCSPNIILVIKLRKMRWAGHVARKEDRGLHRAFWWGNLTETVHFQYLGLDEKTILKRIFWKWNGGHGLD